MEAKLGVKPFQKLKGKQWELVEYFKFNSF